jgi:putative sigma-54 modulation protein
MARQLHHRGAVLPAQGRASVAASPGGHGHSALAFNEPLFHFRAGMKFILSTHNITLTKAIEDHILGRIEKLEHLNRRALEARVIIEHDHTRGPEKAFKCSMRLAVRGPDLYAEDVEGDLYAAIDLVAKKMETQIRKRRSKVKARKHTEAASIKRQRQDRGE